LSTTFLVKAKTKEGFEIHFSGDFPDDFDLLYDRLIDSDFGYSPLATVAVPKGAVVMAATPNGELACQFCGSEVEPVKFGKIDQTAAQVAAGRAAKMGKMGKTAAPVCGKCWKQGGHTAAWDEFYKNSQS